MVFLVVSMFGLAGSLWSQAYEGSIEYDKKKQDAFLIDFAYPPEAAENAIIQKFNQLGYKPKEEKGILNRDKGFKIFKSAFLNEISTSSMDYLFKVEKKSRKEKEESILYLVMQQNGQNAKSGFDADMTQKVKLFLNNLTPSVAAANLEIQITDQEAVVTKAEKKLSSLKTDHDDLEKKIADNEKAQTDTQKDIENQKMRLGELKGQRRN